MIEMREKRLDDINAANPRGNSNIGQSGINVEAAEREFYEVSRQMSVASQRSKHSRVQSGIAADIEKGGLDKEEEEGDEGQFDLEGHLRGTQVSETEAGIRSKKIGMF
jgi:ATP-binding cassette subfamily G (WHITE) protein 2 (SNQ2)